MSTAPRPTDRRAVALSISAAGVTDTGRVRSANEDAFAARTADGLWVVADGMGGHASGQVASRMAVEAIEDFWCRWRSEPDFAWPFDPERGRDDLANLLDNAVRIANVRVYNRSLCDPDCTGMGTTLVLIATDDQGVAMIAHVGDSRAYRLRAGRLRQLTEDHSLVNHLRRVMKLDEATAKARAGRNVIVRAVGLEDDVRPDLARDTPRAEDVYLLCSDGLSDLVDDAHIRRILLTEGDQPEQAATALVAAANEAGGTDNITALVIRVDG